MRFSPRSIPAIGITICMFLVGIVLAVVAAAPPAHACTLSPTYRLSSDLLTAGDFNDPDSAYAQDYDAFSRDDEPAPEILGIYRTEVVATVDPLSLGTTGESGGAMRISRGSVALVTDYWGDPPASIEPFTIGRPVVWEYFPDTGACEFLSYPPDRDVGTVFYVVTTTSDEEISLAWDGSSPDADLDAGFGDRISPEPDLAALDALVAEIEAEHDAALAETETETETSSSAVPIIGGAIGLGLGLLAGLGYWLKRSSAHRSRDAE